MVWFLANPRDQLAIAAPTNVQSRPEDSESQPDFLSRRSPMWRHGDVFIQSCGGIPKTAKRLPHMILAKGEATGHAHRIAERDAASLWQTEDALYLDVSAEQATVQHEEHAPIALKRGAYRVWIQREYTPEAIRRVVD
jgi:hypothetical protein